MKKVIGRTATEQGGSCGGTVAFDL